MKRILKIFVPEPVIGLWHRVQAFAAATLYGFPARHLTVIGITGTDGKTTTVGMLAHILHAQSIAAGALSTAFFRIRDDIQWNGTQKTSPSPFITQRFLRELVKQDCTHAVLECSSHGLTQGRLLFTWPLVAAMTNLSEEHLDYHGTMGEYLRAKSRLFAMLRGAGAAVLNASDPSYETLAKFCTNLQRGLAIQMLTYDETIGHPLPVSSLHLQIPGTFNIENALCAITCASACGIRIADAADALASFKGVPGRMERIEAGQPFAVYVDFTVTPTSYEKTLSTLKSMLQPGGRLLVLTGSCGDRMKEKRPIVGRIVSTYADVTVVANEDPYTEDPEKIIDEVWAGIDHEKTKAYRIVDRRSAIEFLFQEAKPGDIVILCGKGSDTMMWVKRGQIPWNEREIAKEILSSNYT